MTLQITYPYSWYIIGFILILAVTVNVALLAKKSFSLRRKRNGVIVASAICLAALVYYLSSPIQVTLGDKSMSVNCYVRVNINYDSIKRIVFVDSLRNTPYSAKLRTFGWSSSEFMLGYYMLNDGRKAFASIQGHNRICVVDVGSMVYLLSPPVQTAAFDSAMSDIKAKYGL